MSKTITRITLYWLNVENVLLYFLSDGNKFAFGQESSFEFNFSGVIARSPGSGGKSPRSPGAGQDTDSGLEELDEGEGDHIVFQVKSIEVKMLIIYFRLCQPLLFVDKNLSYCENILKLVCLTPM